MGTIMGLIKNWLDWILILLGTYISSYNLFNFVYSRRHQYYYYPDITQFYFALGIVFIVLGVLLYKKKKIVP